MTSCSNTLVEVSDGSNTYLIETDRILRAVGPQEFHSSVDMRKLKGSPVEMNRLDGAPLIKYGVSHQRWRVGDVICIDARDPHPLLQKRWSERKWSSYGSERCVELAIGDDHEGKDNYLGSLPDEEDMGCREIMVRLTKWQPCGRFHSRPRWDQNRKKRV